MRRGPKLPEGERSPPKVVRSKVYSELDKAELKSFDDGRDPVADPEFPDGVGKMEFDGLFRNGEYLADLPIRLSLFAPAEALGFFLRQRIT
jgi:hypothetical protein